MNCELAKQLKDVGFPMKEATDADVKSLRADLRRYPKAGASWYVLPTLEELIEVIEALPYVGKLYLSYSKEENLWSVDTAVAGNKWAHSKFKTLREAAARFWLALPVRTAAEKIYEPYEPNHTEKHS